MSRKKNHVALFAGLGGFITAGNRAGFETVYANDNDPFCCETLKATFPNVRISQTDVRQISVQNEFSQIDEIDLLSAGFPCQSWSANGDLKGIEDARGKLVYPMLKILERAKRENPNVKFLFENVRMKDQFRQFLTKLIGVEPILINSSLLSAQNRDRLYWTNIPKVSQPQDLKLCMNDILEQDRVLESLYYTVGADYTGKTRGHVADLHININQSEKRVYSSDYKCPTLTTMQGGHRQPKVLIGDVQGDHIMRRLTPLECERLQTLEDNYTQFGIMNGKTVKMSNAQRYKTVGNGWTVDVISHILMNI